MHHQLSFRAPGFRLKQEFGGSLLKGNARVKRPLSTSKPMHIVLRSSQARGSKSLLRKKNAEIAMNYLKKFSNQFGVTVYQYANVGNHIHLLLRIKNRKGFAPFIRSFSGALAIAVSGANKNKGLEEKFWDYKPFSRIVETWRRGFSLARDSTSLWRLEILGMIARSSTTFDVAVLEALPPPST